MITRLRAVAERHRVLWLLVVRDLKLKYEGAALGYLWSVLEPLLLAGVYWFVLHKIARLPIENYPLFIIAGILPWMWVNGAVAESTRALSSQARLVTTTRLPREIWVLRLSGSKLVEFLLSLPVLVLFVLVSAQAPSRYLWLLPLVVVVQTLLLTGVALLMSAVSVIVADARRLVRVALRVTFYVSPVLYPATFVPDPARWLYDLNPLVGLLETYRAVWFPDSYPGLHVLAISAVAALAVLAAGWAVFTRLEPAVLKEL